MLDKNIEVSVFSSLGDLDKARADAADLAWDHAKAVAGMFGHSVGSQEHLDIHQELADRYEHSVEHLMFFMQHACATLKALLDTNLIKLNAAYRPLTDEEVSQAIGYMAQMLCSSYMYLAASYETMWPTNDMLPEEIETVFYFTEEEVDSTGLDTKEGE
jgi:hypothetical protein